VAHPGILRVSGAPAQLAGLLLGLAVLVGVPDLASAAKGPWRGQVLDAETKQPLEGVVVLAYWNRYRFSLAQLVVGHQTPEFFDAVEAVTDAQGRWEIPKKSFPFFADIGGPFFEYYKPGYAQWRYAGQDTAEWRQLPGEERMRKSKEMALAVWTEEGGNVEMLPARTPDEVSSKITSPSSLMIPSSLIPLSRAAIDKARRDVGLPARTPAPTEPPK
jgi:hypothetical protein